MFKFLLKDDIVEKSSFTKSTAFKLAPFVALFFGIFVMTLICASLVNSIKDNEISNISGFLKTIFFAIIFLSGLLIALFIYERFDYQEYLDGKYLKNVWELYSRISDNIYLSAILALIGVVFLSVLYSQGALMPILLVLCSLMFVFGSGYSTFLTYAL